MHRFVLAALAAPVASLMLFACNSINIDLEQTQNNGCCCDTCGCHGGAGGGTTTTPEPNACQCPEGYTATPAGDACFRETQVPPVQNAQTYTVCDGKRDKVYGKFGARVESGGTAPGGTVEANTYWGDGSATLNGRLNEVGVWACGAMGSTWNPLKEWIGFSVCIDIPESGEYILGIGADNDVRMSLDGGDIYTNANGTPQAFNYWHLLPIHLTSGSHTIELRGRNNEDIAAFGAEISGPFPAGSLDTDAAVLDEVAYASHLIFSTGSLPPGQVFQLGEHSGWTCPDGTAFDVCAPMPICTDIDYTPCLDKTGGTGGGAAGDPVTKH